MDFLSWIDEARDKVPLPNEIYDMTMKDMETNFNFGVKHLMNLGNFYETLKPKDKQSLIFICL